MAASNGPMPARANLAATARTTTKRKTPAIAMPWTCELDTSRRPSGLHRSHSPASIGTGAPHRAHGWVSSGLTPGAVLGATVCGAVTWLMVPRTAGDDLPASGRLDQRVDVLGRPGEDDRAIGAGRLPALPGLAWRLDPWRVGDRLVA